MPSLSPTNQPLHDHSTTRQASSETISRGKSRTRALVKCSNCGSVFTKTNNSRHKKRCRGRGSSSLPLHEDDSVGIKSTTRSEGREYDNSSFEDGRFSGLLPVTHRPESVCVSARVVQECVSHAENGDLAEYLDVLEWHTAAQLQPGELLLCDEEAQGHFKARNHRAVYVKDLFALQHYYNSARLGLAKAKAVCEDTLCKASDQSRAKRDLEKYRPIMECCVTGRAVLAAQYVSQPVGDSTSKFIFCSAMSARVLLEKAPPELPILIPAALGGSVEYLSPETYLQVLQAGKTIDVHDFQQETDDASPTSIPAAEAISMFKDSSKGPLNFLNLAGHKCNPYPSCLAGLENYGLLTSIDGDNGKKTSRRYCDLRESSSFQLLANAGTVHLPHVDRGGVITTVFCEHGEKLWPLWTRTSLVKLAEDAADLGQSIGLYLEKGTLLIQPGGTPHAPMSITDVLMTGTMHLHSLCIKQSLEQTLLERKYDYITNEEPSQEMSGKMKQILEAWRLGLGPWDWDNPATFIECDRLLSEFNSAGKRRKSKYVIS